MKSRERKKDIFSFELPPLNSGDTWDFLTLLALIFNSSLTIT